jgi:beta-glucuronidase
MKAFSLLSSLILFLSTITIAQEANLITNIESRNRITLNGQWNIIIDPYENGYYDYRYQVKKDGYFLDEKPRTKTHLIEYDFDKSETLNVPGDWNKQKEKLDLYKVQSGTGKNLIQIKNRERGIFYGLER